MTSLWIKVMKRQRIAQSVVAPLEQGSDAEDVLREQLQGMDLPAPIWLNKHYTEFESFNLTTFSPGDFIEDVRFDRIDISRIDDTDVTRRSRDPRNEF